MQFEFESVLSNVGVENTQMILNELTVTRNATIFRPDSIEKEKKIND